MYCFNFFRNQLWQHLISYNKFRNMNMCLLEVAMYEKCRSSHFQSERGVKSLRTGGGVKNFRTGGGGGLLSWGRGYFCWGVSTPLHAMYLPWISVGLKGPHHDWGPCQKNLEYQDWPKMHFIAWSSLFTNLFLKNLGWIFKPHTNSMVKKYVWVKH